MRVKNSGEDVESERESAERKGRDWGERDGASRKEDWVRKKQNREYG